MIHTFELSTMVSSETFEEILRLYKFTYLRGNCWSYKGLSDKGISYVHLCKIPRNKEQKSNFGTWYYMVSVVINTGMLYGSSKEFANNIVAFTPDFIRNIYENILDIIKPLEISRQRSKIDVMDFFKNQRVDFCFDFYTHHEQYLELLTRGKSINHYERKIYNTDIAENDTHEEQQYVEEEEYDVEEYEKCVDIFEEFEADKESVHFNSNSLNINIYRKDKEVKYDSSDIYDYLRIELQLKKRKLYALTNNKNVKSYYMMKPKRALQYMASDVVYREVMGYYLEKLGGNGNYVTKDYAFKLIEETKQISYASKRAKMRRLLELVEDYGSVGTVIDLVKNGEISELGSHKSVMRYIKQLEELGINPVLIPEDMVDSIEEVTLTGFDGTMIKTKMLLSLPQLFEAYVMDDIDARQKVAYEYVQEEIEAAMNQTRDSNA